MKYCPSYIENDRSMNTNTNLLTNLRRSKILLFLASILSLLGCKSSSSSSTQNGVQELSSADITIRFNPEMEGAISDEGQAEPTTHTITIRKGGTVMIIGREHHSVGMSFSVEYDQAAFTSTSKINYDNPLSIKRNECGGDRCTRTLLLKALVSGEHTIVCKGNWRGTTTNIERYIIHVE